MIKILERKELFEELLVLDFKDINKSKILNNPPYNSIRLAIHIDITYPDTPFANQAKIHKIPQKNTSQSLNVKEVQLDKFRINLPEWPSRNKGLIQNDSLSRSMRYKRTNFQTVYRPNSSMPNIKNSRNFNYRSQSQIYRSSVKSLNCPRTVHRNSSQQIDFLSTSQSKVELNRKQFNRINYDVMMLFIPDENKSNQSKKRKIEVQVKKGVSSMKVFSQAQRKKSVFSEMIDKEVDLKLPNENYLSILNYNEEMRKHLMEIEELIRQTATKGIPKPKLKEMLLHAFSFFDVYHKTFKAVMQRNKEFKASLRQIVDQIKSFDSLKQDYLNLNQYLSILKSENALDNEKFNYNADCIKVCRKELKLVKLYGLDYNEQDNKDLEKKLLVKIFNSIKKQPGYRWLLEEKKIHIDDFTGKK